MKKAELNAATFWPVSSENKEVWSATWLSFSKRSEGLEEVSRIKLRLSGWKQESIACHTEVLRLILGPFLCSLHFPFVWVKPKTCTINSLLSNTKRQAAQARHRCLWFKRQTCGKQVCWPQKDQFLIKCLRKRLTYFGQYIFSCMLTYEKQTNASKHKNTRPINEYQ